MLLEYKYLNPHCRVHCSKKNVNRHTLFPYYFAEYFGNHSSVYNQCILMPSTFLDSRHKALLVYLLEK